MRYRSRRKALPSKPHTQPWGCRASAGVQLFGHQGRAKGTRPHPAPTSSLSRLPQRTPIQEQPSLASFGQVTRRACASQHPRNTSRNEGGAGSYKGQWPGTWNHFSNSGFPFLTMKVKVAQSCLTLCDPMDYTVQGILQARILEWVAFPFSRGSSQSRDQTQVSHIAGRFFTS